MYIINNDGTVAVNSDAITRLRIISALAEKPTGGTTPKWVYWLCANTGDTRNDLAVFQTEEEAKEMIKDILKNISFESKSDCVIQTPWMQVKSNVKAEGLL